MTTPPLQPTIQTTQGATYTEATEALKLIGRFISPMQLSAITEAMEGEEQQFFFDKAVALAKTIETMPTTYQTDVQGDAAIAYLHYFVGTFDWFVTEKDVLHEQLQAFGLVRMWEQELGYININELRENQVQLDLYWTPVPLSNITKAGRK